MSTYIGESLVERGIITQAQLDEALQRQRVHGGRLGENLAALGHVSQNEVARLFRKAPPAPRRVEDTKLGLSFIVDLVLKHLSMMGESSLSDIVNSTKLTLSVTSCLLLVILWLFSNKFLFTKTKLIT